MLIAIWVLTLLGLGLWSLTAWGMQALLTMDASRLQDLKPLIHEIPFGETIDQWMPGWRALLAVAIDATQALVAWVGHAAPWLIWALWGVGAAGLLLGAGILSLAVVLIRRGMRTAERAPQTAQN
jgi:hypothetical protein